LLPKRGAVTSFKTLNDIRICFQGYGLIVGLLGIEYVGANGHKPTRCRTDWQHYIAMFALRRRIAPQQIFALFKYRTINEFAEIKLAGVTTYSF
jgi:hypothetical protein